MGRLFGEFWQIDKATGERIRKFNTTKEAGTWIIENKYSDKNLRNVCHLIAECLSGKYKSCYNFKWKLELVNLPNEIWKEIPYLKNVFASTEGRIKYQLQITYGSDGHKNAKNISYKEIRFDSKYYIVHRLIASTFLPNFFGYPQVNYKDGNPQNNRLYNLEWTTAKGNSSHAYDTGLNPKRKKVCQYTLEDIFIKEYEGVRVASRETNVNHRRISDCCLDKQETAGGFIWKYS